MEHFSHYVNDLIKGIFSVEDTHKSLTICPRHRDAYGLRWRSQKTRCAIPMEIAGHKSTSAKGDRGIDSVLSAMVYRCTGLIVSIGSRKYNCNTVPIETNLKREINIC